MWGMISGFVIGVMRLGAKVFYSTSATSAGYSDVKVWAADKGINNVFYNLFYDTNWLFFSGGMLVFSMLVVLIVSRFTAPATELQLRGITLGSASAEDKAATRSSWNHWDVIHSAIILAFTIAFYIYFW
jgi:SSS family solute:Na+ symporter